MIAVVELVAGLFDNRIIRLRLPGAIAETLKMVGWSTLLTITLGLPVGVGLSITGPGGLVPLGPVYRVLGVVVNVGRSLPFLILMIAIIPFTRFVVGTTLGWQAAVVPLTVGAVPFYGRLAESAIRGIEPGKVEAARATGATTSKIVRSVLIREALPGLITAATVTAIALVSYSAMAGTVGGGGLGALAISYGYNRFQTDVMVVTVVVIVLIVQVIQLVGDLAARLVDHR